MKTPLGSSASQHAFDSGLRNEIAGEQAAALGRTAREAERSLAALRASSAEVGSPERAELLKAAAAAVWCYFVQREVNGMRNHRAIIAEFDIPRDVIARLGMR